MGFLHPMWVFFGLFHQQYLLGTSSGEFQCHSFQNMEKSVTWRNPRTSTKAWIDDHFQPSNPSVIWGKTLPETDSSSLKIGRVPKGKDRLPSIHFQVRALSFRQGIPKQNVWKPFFSFSRILSVGWNFKKRKVINSLVLNCHEFLRWSKLVHNDFLFFLVARKPKMGERSYHS